MEATGHIIEYRLKLDSNPEFTSSILVAYARAAKRLADGCIRMQDRIDIAPAYLSAMSGERAESICCKALNKNIQKSRKKHLNQI